MSRHTIVGTFALVLVIVAFDISSPHARYAQSATVTGCLRTGANAGDFVLVADDKETYQVQAAAEGVELAPHANHRVELTGMIEKTETSSVLKTTALKMIASSCEA